MASASVQYLFSEEQYLAIERAAEYRSEYHSGQIFAMAGGSVRHSILSGNLFAEFRSAVGPKGCQAFESNMRLRIAAANAYVYPDSMVICGKPRLVGNSQDIVDNPILVAEVFSPSTELYDRTTKFAKYRTIDSLREYLVVSQSEASVELFSRGDNGRWVVRYTQGLDAILSIESLGCAIPLSGVYLGVQFGEAGEASN